MAIWCDVCRSPCVCVPVSCSRGEELGQVMQGREKSRNTTSTDSKELRCTLGAKASGIGPRGDIDMLVVL